MKKKYFLIIAVVATAFSLGYGAVTAAWPIKDRDPWRGYFTNVLDFYGGHVWNPGSGPSSCRGSSSLAIPNWVNTKSEFISFVRCKLSNGNTQERTGAQFIIQTMRGSDNGRPSSSDIRDWESRVRNSNVGVTWSTTRSYTVNSYYQGTSSGSNPNDDAFFDDSGSGSAIVFHIPGQDYVIRRQCANPVGNGGVPTLPPGLDYNMSGRSTVNDTTAIPGQVLTFRHYLRNSGPTNTSPDSINYTIRNTISGGAALLGNAGTFADDQEKRVRTHSVTVPNNAVPGSRICYRVEWRPDTENGGSGAGSPACSTVQANYDLRPTINVRINGGSVPGNFAEPGDTVSFTYAITNSRSGYAFNTDCTIYGKSKQGYQGIPSPIDSSSDSGFSEPSHGCPRNFPSNSTTTLVTETISGGSVEANRSICRSLFVDPATTGGSSRGTEACVYVAAKPYFRSYGGDISAGGGFSSTPGVCALNSRAAVIGWNKRGSGSWAGAGVQFATYAMHTIFDSSTTMGNGSGSAPKPNGLSFGNSGVGSNSSAGRFGGHLGSVACIPDHYSTRPASTTPVSSGFNISSLGSGSYSASGNVRTVGGQVNPGEKINIYIDGNLYLDGNIIYDGSGGWNTGNIPMLRIIVRGNIFIDNDVSQIDGLYVAQPSSSTNGIIATCTTGSSPYAPLPLNGRLGSDCDKKLTVNGSLVARQVRLMRTIGTLRSSNINENPASGNMAEAFNYGPGLWISQPSDSGGSADYDAINSLPPIL